MCLERKKKVKSKVRYRGFCLRDFEAKHWALRSFHIFYSNVSSYSSAPESNKQNLPDRTIDLPFFFRKGNHHITSLESVPSHAPSEKLSDWFQGNFAAMFVLNYLLREVLLSVFANRFDLRCEPKHLMLLYYTICPCYLGEFHSPTRTKYMKFVIIARK